MQRWGQALQCHSFGALDWQALALDRGGQFVVFARHGKPVYMQVDPMYGASQTGPSHGAWVAAEA
jgi:hypothetical protein